MVDILIARQYWRQTVACLADVVKQLREELDITLDFMNVGGGIGIPYRPGEAAVQVRPLAKQMHDQLCEAWKEIDSVRTQPPHCDTGAIHVSWLTSVSLPAWGAVVCSQCRGCVWRTDDTSQDPTDGS